MLQPKFKDIKPICSVSVQAIFNETFQEGFNTVLEGGFDEPLYLPAASNSPAKVLFRDDYVSSALHEISHWVVAGESRRLLEDYGYWYETDGRDLAQQKKFEQVEVKPQSIELLLHFAAGLKFRVSVDNLALPDYDSAPFEVAVKKQVERFLDEGSGELLPVRAVSFIRSLFRFRGVSFNDTSDLFKHLATAV
ncbi:elongation factor P hydroxylase [Marinomonas sp. S3726]|uniref:elongation factor P hydroxylase n=1 Tax=Marinomonas sp. S3726 TaxID=579484 RepID=UPI000A7B724A|nr:elongation factor P hydroxylase [Marinomonas sp. S3726]